MTAARQERKVRRRKVVSRTILALSALVAAAVCAPTTIRAAISELVIANRYTGLAIDGYDPVTYFVDGAPQVGRAEFEWYASGATWRFRNEGNRAAFKAAPAVYAPAFGGYDPVAVARGAATPGNPSVWLIADQRLYLFYSDEARAAFAADPDSAIDAAERGWPGVRRALVRN
jgi:hypothetical protein